MIEEIQKNQLEEIQEIPQDVVEEEIPSETKEENQEKEDVYYFTTFLKYIFVLEAREDAEKKLATLSQIIEGLRFYKMEQQINAWTFEKGFHRELKRVFPAKELIEIIGEDPSLQDLQQVLDGKNIAYNQMLERCEKSNARGE